MFLPSDDNDSLMSSRLTGVCQSYGGLIACRLLLGAVEGGLFPGAAIYLTIFYTKREIAVRIGYLFVSAALAGACGGLLAYGTYHIKLNNECGCIFKPLRRSFSRT